VIDCSFYRTSSGADMYVEETGAGPPILAIHGLGGGAWFFGGLARRLAADHRVIAVDLPGTGRSAAPGAPYSLDTWVADLGDFVRTRVRRPVALLGHSMGTILALRAWESWPDQLGALVFVGGLPEPRALIRTRLAERAAAVRAAGMAGWGRRASPGIFSPATIERQPELVALFERLFDAQDAGTYARCCEILLGASAAPVVRSVSAPCLAITGADDQYAPPELVRAFLGELPAPARCDVLPDCGHLPFLEAPGACAGAVRTFLAALC
jgi:3-oxoadipate enol-lactonase